MGIQNSRLDPLIAQSRVKGNWGFQSNYTRLLHAEPMCSIFEIELVPRNVFERSLKRVCIRKAALMQSPLGSFLLLDAVAFRVEDVRSLPCTVNHSTGICAGRHQGPLADIHGTACSKRAVFLFHCERTSSAVNLHHKYLNRWCGCHW